VRAPDFRRFAAVAALFVLFSATYEYMRYLVGPDAEQTPFQHAHSIVHLERSLGLFVEPQLQAMMHHSVLLESAAVFVYKYEHLGGSILFLAALWWLRPSYFPFVWRWFWLAHVLAVLGFWLYPLAPPRLVLGLGMTDSTAAAVASTPGASQFDLIRNEFAAMPSLHCGYPLMFAVILWFLLRGRRVRLLVWLWPAALLFTVMATANHYWMDAAGGALTIGVALLIALKAFPQFPRPWSEGSTAQQPAPAVQILSAASLLE
jgi:hypothetical protein